MNDLVETEKRQKPLIVNTNMDDVKDDSIK